MNNIEASGSDIITWSRDIVDDKFVVTKKLDTSFRPYFYVSDSLGSYVSVFGEKVKKIFVRLPSDVPKMRTQYEKHFEADVLYCSRWLFDSTDKLKKESIRVCYIDIETESGVNAPQKFINTDSPENKILSICVYDNFTEKYKIFCLSEKIDFDECEIEFFDDEVALLKAFCKYVKKNDVDLFCGYNIINFDIRYIINRMRMLRMDASLLSRDSAKTYIDDYGHIHIWGRNLYDLWEALKDLISGERPSWKLGDVCNDELGYGKTEYKGELWELWRDDRKKFLSYNKNDVKLCVDLDKHFSLLDFHDEIRRITKVSWDNLYSKKFLIDGLLFQYCKGRYILPSTVKREKVDYEGAYTNVFDSGLFKNVLGFDFRSLYPTIMMIFNISFETVSENFTGIAVGNGVYFRKDKLGLIPEMLYDLFKKRMYYKSEMKKYSLESSEYRMYNARQQAYKILLNSMYGVTGTAISRVYEPRCASSITFVGRKIITKTIEIAESRGLKVLFSHTDSIYVSVPDVSDEKELEAIGKRLSKEIGDEVRKIIPKSDLLKDVSLDLEFDSICRTAFFNKEVRNRNARLVIYQDGKWLNVPKLKITGFSSIRSDVPKVVQNLLNTVFTMILEEKKEDEVLKVVKDFECKFLDGRFYINDICVSSSIKVDIPKEIEKGTPYHVKGAVNANLYFDANISRGDKVKLYYVLSNSKNIDIIAFTDKAYSGLEPDLKKMWNRYKVMFENVFDCMKWFSLKTGSVSMGNFKGKRMKKNTVSGGEGLLRFKKK